MADVNLNYRNNLLKNSNSSVMTHETSQAAVSVVNAIKSYRGGNLVLNNLNMTVPMGSVYGLLGASGCGKTTIFSCIVGLRKLGQGTIKVFGTDPSLIGSNNIGFMPQEDALYDVFTIKEMLSYYGKLYGMTPTEISSREGFLLEFLDLPESNTLVKNLSGGQMRRVSLAVAIIHSPPLLILDEPTIGLDVKVKLSIWEHLETLVKRNRTTIVMSTHYIEEAKRCATVGIMRRGRLLVEECPKSLLEKHETIFLEKVFLKLCHVDETGQLEQSQRDPISPLKPDLVDPSQNNGPVQGLLFTSANTLESIQCHDPASSILRKKYNSGHFEFVSHNLRIIQAMLLRYFLFLWRTPWFACVVLLINPFQMMNIIHILGHNPKHVPLGIVNKELPPGEDLRAFCSKVPQKNECLPDWLSCRFFNQFSDEDIHWVSHSSELEAVSSVEKGATWGYLAIPENYTAHLRDRSLLKNYMTNETIQGSTVTGRLDLSFNLKSSFITFKAYDALRNFLMELAESCNISSKAVDVPWKYNAVYGKLDSNYSEYMQTGFFVLATMLTPMACSLYFIRDRKTGCVQRTYVAGAKFSHVVFSMLISEWILLVGEVLLCYIILRTLGDLEMLGSPFLFTGLAFIVGTFGILTGMVFGLAVDQESEAVYLILSVYLPLMVSSGGTWPSEGLNPIAGAILSASPTTLPIRALRSIATRGWGLTHPKVWPGFAMALLWISFFVVLSVVVHRVRNK